MSDRDLFIAIYLAVISSGEPGNAHNIAEYTRTLYDTLKLQLKDV